MLPGGITNTETTAAFSPGRSVQARRDSPPVVRADPFYSGLRVAFGSGESLAAILARAANSNVVVRYIDARKSRIVVRGVQILDGMWLTGLRGVPGSGVFHFSADSARSRYCELVAEIGPAFGPSFSVSP